MDDCGRIIARTDYNAGNDAAGIPNIHHHTYEYDSQYPFGCTTGDHIPGVYIP